MTWLILSILGLGVSYANDVYLEDPADHMHQSVSDNNIDIPDDHNGHCHSMVHLLGLMDNRVITSAMLNTSPEHTYFFSLRPYFATNLLRPPRTI